MIKVLFLSAWYPNRYDAMAGLFVRKHAEAVSLYCDVKVLYVHGDKKIKHFQSEVIQYKKVTETLIYYPSKNFLLKNINFFIAYLKGFILLRRSGFKPDVIHANILTRTVFIAFWYRIFHNTPYVVTEHWSRYLPSRNGYHGIIRKALTKIVISSSSAVLPVSKHLQDAMIINGLNHPNYKIIHNVVDDFFFHKSRKAVTLPKKFLHISCFDEKAKNVKGILRAVKSLSTIRTDFEFIIIGTGIDFNEVFTYYKSLEFQNNIVQFLGEKEPGQVAEWFEKSDCFVLFSNYETAGVVIAESLACGKPVISTRVGIAEEFINESAGILLQTGDEAGLTNAMNHMLDNTDNYKSDIIRQRADIFRYQLVGSEISNIYQEIL
jgi:glycosyltransferase involved in cell wall biosynthesis